MKPDHPSEAQIPGLRRLWKTAFGDDDAWLDQFFSLAYAPERCLCIADGTQVLAALYWFDVSCENKPLAYLYAVATDPACRNQGLCRTLIAAAKERLTQLGYAGALLKPENAGLSQMYERMGFRPCTTVTERQLPAAPAAAPVRRLDATEYARLRREMLPKGGVVQEGAALALLENQAQFFSGPDFLAAVSPDVSLLHCHEFLGNPDAASALLHTLGYSVGFFRFPGGERPFASFCPLSPDCPKPAYFGLALD